MKVFRFIIRLVPGLVFLFSGFVKAVDPSGSAYKFSDYFTAFHLDFLDPLALPLSLVLSSFELLIGFSLIAGYCRKASAWALLLFMGFFTILTFALALLNPVSDCGCFGDALILTNWQTFYKNIILLPFVLLIFAWRKQAPVHARITGDAISIVILLAVTITFSLYNLRHLPVIDFRPYTVGTFIREKMELPPDAPVDQYETTLVYRELASGDEKEFNLEDYPHDTTAWKFVDAHSKLIAKGYEPPIHDFTFTDPYGNDLTQEFLENREPTILMVSYNLEKADIKALKKGAEWSKLADISSGLNFMAVTASTGQTIKSVCELNGIQLEFFSADEIMLKTVIRSNPGFLLVRDGVIEGKWAARDFPAVAAVDPGWNEQIEQVDGELDLLIESEGFEDIDVPVITGQLLHPGPKVVSTLLTINVKSMNRCVTGIYMLFLLLAFSLLRFNRKAYNGPNRR